VARDGGLLLLAMLLSRWPTGRWTLDGLLDGAWKDGV
jgi:hypothetical protein